MAIRHKNRTGSLIDKRDICCVCVDKELVVMFNACAFPPNYTQNCIQKEAKNHSTESKCR